MLKIKLPAMPKKPKKILSMLLVYIYQSFIPMVCGMYSVLLALTGHPVFAFIILLPALAPFIIELRFE